VRVARAARAKKPDKTTKAATAQRFRGKLTGEGPNAAWTFMKIPATVTHAFGARGRVSVRGTINGFAFRSSIFPDGQGGHAMMVNKAMRAGAKADQGDTVDVAMAIDAAPRDVEVPVELKKAMKASPAAAAWFKQLAPSSKKEFAEHVTGAKRPETRAARVAKVVARLEARKRRLDD
jgi:hypothetical protein